MQHIMIVTETESFLLTSIKEKLEKTPYRVSLVPADTDAINDIKEPVCGVVVYAEKKLLEQQQALTFLKDRVIMEDIPVFTVGRLDNLKEVKTVIPNEHIIREFSRPINVNSLTETVDHLIRQYSGQLRKKILVVDDSGAMLRSVKGWLGDRYNVFLANSAAMAIKYLTLNRPDLVLLDYAMPVVDGKQVLEMIRTETEFSNIPVMFLTAKEDKESFLNVVNLKPEGYLLKTMPPERIVKTVDDFFEKSKGMYAVKGEK
ncbi:MAG: response regulator [Oscillospiraceae bacterium]|jgi:CheY-like chemotaxis protein|nr:response regulator [Oscillospiraceae bacterium]